MTTHSYRGSFPNPNYFRFGLTTNNSHRWFGRKNAGRSTPGIISRDFVRPNDAHGPSCGSTSFPNSYPLWNAGTGYVN